MPTAGFDPDTLESIPQLQATCFNHLENAVSDSNFLSGSPGFPKQRCFWSRITNKCVEIVVGFIDAFLDFPQHVSANNCHHQEGRSALEATQARCVVDVYGLWFVQRGKLSGDAAKCVQWVRAHCRTWTHCTRLATSPDNWPLQVDRLSAQMVLTYLLHGPESFLRS
jgi:hypothetical protein